MMRRLFRIAVGLFAVLCTAANAQRVQEYMLMSAKSWHLNATRTYNERNLGVGYQRFEGDGAILKGWTWNLFHDSDDNPSGYLGYAWQYRLIDANVHVDAGAVAFLMTRADVLSNVPFPAVLPYISVGNRKYFANVTLIPGFENAKGVIFLQVGVRLNSNSFVSGALVLDGDDRAP